MFLASGPGGGVERILPIGPFIQKETFDSTEALDVQTTHSRTAAFAVPLQKSAELPISRRASHTVKVSFFPITSRMLGFWFRF